jgi:hypothetical protein
MQTALAAVALCAAFAAASQQDPGSTPTPQPQADPKPAAAPQPAVDPAPKITDKLKADAASLAPIMSSSLAKEFLAATAQLPEPATRTVYRNRERGTAVSSQDYELMSADARTGFAARECSPEFYFETGYGSPLVYARVLDLAAPHLAKGAPPRSSTTGTVRSVIHSCLPTADSMRTASTSSLSFLRSTASRATPGPWGRGVWRSIQVGGLQTRPSRAPSAADMR